MKQIMQTILTNIQKTHKPHIHKNRANKIKKKCCPLTPLGGWPIGLAWPGGLDPAVILSTVSVAVCGIEHTAGPCKNQLD